MDPPGDDLRIAVSVDNVVAKGNEFFAAVSRTLHLVHRNHTRAFFELQTREMPDWEKWKNKLENLLA